MSTEKFQIKEQVPLAPFTSVKVGGPARFFLQATSADEIKAAATWAGGKALPVFVLGGGSNLLISDKGYDGLVIRVVDSRVHFSEDGVVGVGTGFSLSRLAAEAASRSLSGLEFAMGIPGTVGGAIRGNAGAFGGEMKDVVRSVTTLTPDGSVKTRAADELDFRYRHSIFKTNTDIILSCEIQLQKGDREEIRALQRERLEYRRARQPLELPSFGSTFKNVDFAALDPSLDERFHFSSVAANGVVAAGYLIDRMELKGFSVGGAQVSEKHANFLINTGEATAEHFAILIGIIQQKARTVFTGLHLELEIQFVGF